MGKKSRQKRDRIPVVKRRTSYSLAIGCYCLELMEWLGAEVATCNWCVAKLVEKNNEMVRKKKKKDDYKDGGWFLP